MVLAGTTRDLVDHTQEEESEGALSSSESQEKTRQCAQVSHSTGTKKVQKEAQAAQQQRIPHCRTTTQEAARHRKECWGPELHGA
ncbi:hypothetical protein NDU88_004279 [Pleurodeles waltl]|uniref:Uncharacterized protein n=1 Tax=Pleurodeles waltl TaxID=8319 RepID=A0AAV7NTA1_PLEWA|nr:hypothetical protein NDU88_004279 [Pleurodeles waltl]